MNEKVVIIGAGLVGALWATILGKKGYEVDVYERRTDMRNAGFVGGRSINLALSERGWRALNLAGIASAIKKEAIPMRGRLMHSETGILTFQPYGKGAQAIYSVSRGGLNLKLIEQADQLPSVTFHFDSRCTKIDLKTKCIYFSDKRNPVEYELLFGTDGAFSAVRGVLQKTPRFDYSQSYLEHGYKELSISPDGEGKHKLDANALHIWPRGKFMLIALPNMDGSYTCTLFLPFEGSESFDALSNPEKVQAFFDQYFSDAVPLIDDLVESFSENPTSSLITVKCSPWTNGQDVMLLGDAAHAIVPFYGQGMNAGFEDCSVLVNLLDKTNGNWKEAFEKFNAGRISDGNAIADLAIRNFVEMRDKVADDAFILRKKIEKWLHEEYPNEFIPVYSQVTFTHIPYSKALTAIEAQDSLFVRIMAIPDIENNYSSQEVRAVFNDWNNTQNAN